MAIVATGPMPGSTPIRVPSRQPMKQYRRLIGVTATPKPVIRLETRSMDAPSQREEPLSASLSDQPLTPPSVKPLTGAHTPARYTLLMRVLLVEDDPTLRQV